MKLNVGLIGLGRLGRVYARDLAARVTGVRLAALADTNAKLAEETARELDVPRWYADPIAMMDDPGVDAIIIVSPTDTHTDLAVAALERKKSVFCEKPPAISLSQTQKMKDAAARTHGFLQMGFMRRFDAGYAAAKKKLDEGVIGTAIVFKSSSRDPYRPSLEYANPKSSGGMIMDMGIHDFDLARWYMGEAASVTAIGGTLAYPELNEVGDIDNAIVTITFASGRIGVVDLSRSGIYGYDIFGEILGTTGTLRIGYLRETPLFVMTKNHIAHDTVPFFMERFRDAYPTQLQNFVDNLRDDRQPPITIDDAMGSLRIALAATRAQATGKTVLLSDPSL
ncbi:MAG TPA: Gfo/Idh/MocA family oxidoreductase [Candidatus Acidoferrales bacterium]